MTVKELIGTEYMPRHIGIIMDGNGRWAKKRGMPRTFGHKMGAKVFNNIAEYANEIGIKYLTVYTFSTENWKRPKEEVDTLMDLMGQYLDNLEYFKDKNGRVKILGDITPFSDDLKEKIRMAERESAGGTGITVNIALNYGGRDEIVHSVKRIAEKVKNGELDPCDIDAKCVEDHLYTAGQPMPDFILRPGGEKRLSNFLMWQSAYSELIFSDKLWPDFKSSDLDAAILEYISRDRRFGAV